jgi:PAS domain S-box-containing protein
MTRSSSRASLRFTLSAVISALTISIVAAVSARLMQTRNEEGERELRRKAIVYAELLAKELESAVAFDDLETSREVFVAARLDRDIQSIGLYRQDGSLLDKIGDPVPLSWAASPESSQLRSSSAALDALAPVISHEGPRGILVLRVSRERLFRARRVALLEAAKAGLAALIISLVAAWLIAGRLARRLARIEQAAGKVTGGDLLQPPVEPGTPDEIGRLTVSFNAMVAQQRQLIEQRQAAAAMEQERLEQLVEARTVELGKRNDELQRSRERYRLIIETTSAIPWEYSLAEGRVTYVGPQALKLLGYPLASLAELDFLRARIPSQDEQRLLQQVTKALADGAALETEFRMTTAEGKVVELRGVSTLESDKHGCVRGLMLDVTQRKKLEVELQQAQKLESVGRLASGIAHEINTPIQFVSDSLVFVREAFQDTLALVRRYQEIKDLGAAGALSKEHLDELRAHEETADLDYLVTQVPKALDRALEGLERVAMLVRSMKEFAHPDQKDKVAANLNEALATTLIIARSEYKYVANVETSFGDIPPLLCHVSELNQAFLNIIVNAGHAIGELVAGTNALGIIRVATRREDQCIVILISDTGSGVPAAIRDKIFDPFFTTKPVGKGTGQGLAIARSMVVDKHGGTISLDSEPGRGTSFTIRLPLGSARGGSGAYIAP